ncbi:hypothetical protein [Clostridium botulinum]|uniref:Uncharacterized protein n=1 Tax=Clostridium botulinum TaxID=1491 RepID=A0A6G4ED70_CLOBO|nr:hypothetical protein [Clostridium botulinum]AUM91526.1 hypothetical protein RSJ5_09655 [Clostridium botulinum]NFB12925.1 hypothetical protein [Clostridium botulinum]NFH57855.1 hypothetical protein [Clostridium botulinum]NFH61182.1 hypothetical protein [Clostridium botulinum]NFJ87272.1 hypothetical protein [Clostridium botulinum]
MLQINNKSESNFSICFGGSNEIEAESLIRTLEYTLELINYAVNEKEKDAYIKINVKGTRKGSFEVQLMALAGFLPTLITPSNIDLAKTCIDSVCGILNIKKHLKGAKPKSVTSKDGCVNIENLNCEKIEVNLPTYNLYSEKSDKILSKIFTGLDRESFAIKQENKSKVLINNDEFDNMKKEIVLDKIEDYRIIKNETKVELSIKKPDLTGNSQWEFTYPLKNKIIKSAIEDTEFINKVHLGDIVVSAKTTILVRLQVETYLDEINEKVKEIFTIKEVIEVKQNIDEQLKF